MHAAAKLIIGLLILIAGIYWYIGPRFSEPCGLLGTGICPTRAFMDVFVGVFGLVLIFFGLIVAWIEYEDIRWASREKKKK